MENKRVSFVFYRSFQEAIDEADKDTQLAIYRAISNYALDKIEPTFENPYANIMWKLIKPQLDANWQRFENGFKGASHGYKGGNPNFKKGESNPYYNNPKDNPKDNPKITPNVNVNVNDNDNIKETTIVAKKDGLSLTHKQDVLEKNKEEFKESIKPYLEKYDRDLLNDFFQYWTEPNKSGTRMRFQLEKTWDIGRRLARWAKNQK